MEAIHQLIFSITKNLGIEPNNIISINKEFLLLINEKDAEWYQIIKSCYGNHQSYIFIKKDKELRMKAKDIWEEQKEYFKNALIKDLEKIQNKINDTESSQVSLIKEIIINL